MAGGTGEELGHIHCYAECEKRLSNSRSWPLSPPHAACPLVSEQLRAGAAGGGGSAGERRKTRGGAGSERRHRPRSSEPLALHLPACMVCCLALLLRLQRKKQNSFHLTQRQEHQKVG